MSKVKSYYGGSTSHYYTYNGSTLVQEKIVTSGSQTTEYLTFLYNSEGPTGFVYNNTLYTYRKNIFGDIIAIYQGNTKVAEYAYDAYGNCTIVFATGNAGILNPFRYRGYYFDEDMKLYYLQSRYYDPETGRFINADDVSYLDPETIHGLNLYAYCLNNPVMYVDPSGHIAVSSVVIGLIIGVAIGLGAALYIDYSDDGQVFNGSVEWYHYLFAGTIGGLLGAVIGYLFPAISGFLNATFTFSLPTLGTVSGGGSLALVSGTTISFTGAQVAQGIAVVAGVTVMQAIIGKSGGYRVEIYNNDHDPAHVHIYGDNITGKHGIRIGIDGKPLPGQNKLPHGARKALKKLWKKILEKLLSWGN